MSSAYMHWVKTLPKVSFNLANSGVKNYPLSELPADFQSFSLSGPGAYGYPPLVEALGKKCGVDPACVATAQGTSMANHLAMAAILQPGDEALIEHPGYSLIWETASNVGATVKLFERDEQNGFSVDIEALRRAISPKTRLIVLTNLHNPSCALLDKSTLSAIGEIAQSVNARVLVDEVYLDLLFDDTPETSFKLGHEFVVTSSLTKVYGLSGLRCGWILAEPELIRRICRLHDLYGVNNPSITDQLSCVALSMLPKIAAWSRGVLDENRILANQFLADNPGLQCTTAKAGTVLFPRVPVPAADLCRLLWEEFDTIITPGEFFGAPDHIRIGIGGEKTVVEGGLERIAQALKQLEH